MYAAFFGLSQPPFSIAPDPRYLFMSERHREALAHLLYGIESGGGFVLLTGEIGAGKTTVCRRVLEQIPENARVAYIFNPKLTVSELLQTVCHEFGVAVNHHGPGAASIKEYLDPLNAHLLQGHARGEHHVLIIDEAQALSVEVLEQLRLLTNLETHERKLLQIILIGQPELRQMLARPELEQLAQRVIARFHLGALSEAETRQYIAHRLGVAGWQGAPPFTAGALKRVHRLTRGVPRRINLLCDRALLGAYAGSSQQVTATIVHNAAAEVFDGAVPQPNRSMGWKAVAGGVLAGAALASAAAVWWDKLVPAAPISQAPKAATAPVPAEASATQPKTSGSSVASDIFTGLPPQSAWIEKEDQAFGALSPLWGTPLGTETPCSEAQENGLQCYRTPRMTEHGLRQLDRPAVLKLFQPGQGGGYLLATAIVGNTIELRDAQQRRWQLPLSELGSVWEGYYASLWRTPPGQKGRLNNGFQGPTATQWMEEKLSSLQATGQLTASAKTLKDKVQAFQVAKGIEVNGIASPTTLILINRASGIPEPRLLTPSP